MARGGSDPFVERVREATDLVELIGAHVALKKSGARLAGLCPFHQEKTPSFYVNPALQIFHCFGCGTGGDAFTFIMLFEKMSFPEALRHLAERAGIPLPERRGPSSDLLERIREALRMAQGWYREQLEGPAGQGARAYLAGRGIDDEACLAYAIGFAPDAWDGFLRHASGLVSERTLIEAGLAAESAGGRVYDRFRNRVMIPLHTGSGAPVGFGGRVLGDGEPKYLNSPETAVYHKGSVLFGVGPAREGIRASGRVVVVEGYFDVIALARNGITEAVGTCGTALTPDQGRVLRRLASGVVLLFDGDPAGVRAALRALPVLVGEVDDLRVAFPPEGKDPDQWIREDGPDAVRGGLEGARPALMFLEDLSSQGILNRREAASRAADLIAVLTDPLTRDLWIQEAASRFGVRAEAFDEAVRRRLRSGPRSGPGQTGAVRSAVGGTAPSWAGLEAACLRVALRHPEEGSRLAAAVEDAGGLDPELPDLLRWISATAADGTSAAGLLSRAIREHPAGPRLNALTAADSAAEPVEDLLNRLTEKGFERRGRELTRALRRAQETGNREDEIRYLAERERLREERRRWSRERGTPGRSAPGADPGESSEKRLDMES